MSQCKIDDVLNNVISPNSHSIVRKKSNNLIQSLCYKEIATDEAKHEIKTSQNGVRYTTSLHYSMKKIIYGSLLRCEVLQLCQSIHFIHFKQ